MAWIDFTQSAGIFFSAACVAARATISAAKIEGRSPLLILGFTYIAPAQQMLCHTDAHLEWYIVCWHLFQRSMRGSTRTHQRCKDRKQIALAGFRLHIHGTCTADALPHRHTSGVVQGTSQGNVSSASNLSHCCANATATTQIPPYVELTYRRYRDRLSKIVICIVKVDQHTVAQLVSSVECTLQ